VSASILLGEHALYPHHPKNATTPRSCDGRAYLRAVAEDLDELDVHLVELAAGEPDGELKRLLLATRQGCRAIVGTIAERLPALGAPEEA
jgi:hypothetical protein